MYWLGQFAIMPGSTIYCFALEIWQCTPSVIGNSNMLIGLNDHGNPYEILLPSMKIIRHKDGDYVDQKINFRRGDCLWEHHYNSDGYVQVVRCDLYSGIQTTYLDMHGCISAHKQINICDGDMLFDRKYYDYDSISSTVF